MKGPVNSKRLAVGALAAVAALLGGTACANVPCGLSISTDARLPTGAVGADYFFPLEVVEGCDGVLSDRDSTWRVEDGSLPPGLKLSIGGDFDGVPATAGEFTFGVSVEEQDPNDPNGPRLRDVVVKQFFLTIDPRAP